MVREQGCALGVACDGDADRFGVVDGDIAWAQELDTMSQKFDDVFNANGRNYYVALKTAMNLFGRPGGYPRPPLKPLGEPHLGELRVGLERIGLRDVEPIEAAVAE